MFLLPHALYFRVDLFDLWISCSEAEVFSFENEFLERDWGHYSFLSAPLFAIMWINTLDLERNEWSAKVVKDTVKRLGFFCCWWCFLIFFLRRDFEGDFLIYLSIYLILIYALLFPILRENNPTSMEFIYTAVYVSIYLYNTLFYRM